MEASRHLRLIDAETGEVLETDPTIKALEAENAQLKEDVENAEGELRQKRSQISKLKNELVQAMGVEPEAEQIMDVLEHWRRWCMPNAKIVVGSERWLKVRARLREKDAATKQPCYTPLTLRAAAIGAKLSDFHVRNNYLDAVTIYRDSKTVDDHVARAITFKRTYGESALTIVDELAGEGLRWLAERCACGHVWMEHLYHGGPTPDGRQPCSSCGCEDFDWFSAKLERAQRELEERAKTDPQAAAQLRDDAYLKATQAAWKERQETLA